MPLIMMPHALARFKERIEPLDDEAIQAWADLAWKKRKAKHAPRAEQSKLVSRKFKEEVREYLQCRSPSGRLVFLALSKERDAVLTVLDLIQWQTFIGAKPKGDAKHRERIIKQLLERERQGIE